ncbi:MAG: NAD-dependent succinate-semialdehyde dehydrogenase [Pirellulales bacterium]
MSQFFAEGQQSRALIGGNWCEAASGQRLDVIDPATGVAIGSVPEMAAVDTDHAIEAAATALHRWRQQTAKARGQLLRQWFEAVTAATSDLAAIITAESGKPLAEARGEVAYAAAFLEWYAEEARRAYGDVIPPHQADKRLLVIRQPIGVAAAITPWNFPAAMILRKAAAALAAGCTMVVKPAPQTPLTALALATLAEQAGLPPGVLNVVTGSIDSSREIGAAICESPTVRALSFTGSTAAGVALARQAAGTVKKVSLELGGNASFIVFDDADLDAAVAGALTAKFRNTGQTCVCANRLFVQAEVHDAFVEKFAAAVAQLNVGPGADEGVAVGPLIDSRAVEKVTGLVADAVAAGGRPVLGGTSHSLGGTFFEPTVITGATPAMRLAREEIFGPVAAVFRFETEAEVLELANDTEFGLASYFYSRDVGRCFRVAEALECGMVGINTGILSTEVAPFGGVKSSGLGREGGRYGLDEYQELKYLCFGEVL